MKVSEVKKSGKWKNSRLMFCNLRVARGDPVRVGKYFSNAKSAPKYVIFRLFEKNAVCLSGSNNCLRLSTLGKTPDNICAYLLFKSHQIQTAR